MSDRTAITEEEFAYLMEAPTRRELLTIVGAILNAGVDPETGFEL